MILPNIPQPKHFLSYIALSLFTCLLLSYSFCCLHSFLLFFLPLFSFPPLFFTSHQLSSFPLPLYLLLSSSLNLLYTSLALFSILLLSTFSSHLLFFSFFLIFSVFLLLFCCFQPFASTLLSLFHFPPTVLTIHCNIQSLCFALSIFQLWQLPPYLYFQTFFITDQSCLFYLNHYFSDILAEFSSNSMNIHIFI